MKYIRSKDGIYVVTYDGLGFKEAKSQNMLMLVERKNEKGKIEYEEITVHKELAMGKNHFKEQIIAQADTIEELCDEFVLHYNYTKQANIPIPWATYERRDDNWQKRKEKLISELKNTKRSAIVYGAIWTDKGLIYVAKMNEKGELELI